jgi:hypothetical protein
VLRPLVPVLCLFALAHTYHRVCIIVGGKRVTPRSVLFAPSTRGVDVGRVCELLELSGGFG